MLLSIFSRIFLFIMKSLSSVPVHTFNSSPFFGQVNSWLTLYLIQHDWSNNHFIELTFSKSRWHNLITKGTWCESLFIHPTFTRCVTSSSIFFFIFWIINLRYLKPLLIGDDLCISPYFHICLMQTSLNLHSIYSDFAQPKTSKL